MNIKIDQIENLKPNSIHDIISPDFFFELGSGHDEYLLSKKYYEYYYAISKFYQPKSILEIGVRFGYSLGSMIKGSDVIENIIGVDMNSYEYNSIEIAENNIRKYINNNINYNFFLQDSHSILELPNFYDLIHIDGDHSYEGKIQDLNLTIGKCKTLIVDDYNYLPEVRKAADDWMAINKISINDFYVLDSTRGTLIIELKS